MKKILTLGTLVGMFMLGSGCAGETDEPCDDYGVNVGKCVKDYEFSRADGENVSVHEYHGDVRLISLVAGFCGPCRDEAEYDLPEIYAEYGDENFMIFEVLITDQGGNYPTSEDLEWWFDECHNGEEPGWNAVYDSDWKSLELDLDGYIPYNVIVDKSGRIRYSDSGSDVEKIENKIERWLW